MVLDYIKVVLLIKVEYVTFNIYVKKLYKEEQKKQQKQETKQQERQEQWTKTRHSKYKINNSINSSTTLSYI